LMSLARKNDMLWSSSSFPTDPTPGCVDFIGATRSRAAGAC
jgi:hypothetical protein